MVSGALVSKEGAGQGDPRNGSRKPSSPRTFSTLQKTALNRMPFYEHGCSVLFRRTVIGCATGHGLWWPDCSGTDSVNKVIGPCPADDQ